jgi:predicted ferric reductase
MMIFLAPTFWFFGRPDYQRWKLLHSTAGLATLFALAHTLPLSRAVPGLPGRVIWLLLGASSIAAFVYRSILAPRFARKPYRITAVDSLAPRIVELTLAPEDGLLQYRPGQFVYLTPLDPKLAAGRNEEHPFTLSSAPEETVLRIAVRSAGDATAALQKISVGSRALVEGPYGDFFATERNDKMPELWLAGGIGLAPFLSRGRSLARGGAPRDIYLIYCVEDESRAYFLRELEEIRTKIPNLRVAPHFFRHEGPLTADFIAAHCPDFMKRAVYVCGPPAMIQRVRLELAKRAPSSQIRSEDFAWL